MKVEDYLERIGYRGGREPGAENLAALVKAHRLAVPYETLDLWRGRHVTLATETLFDKIVTHRRGGYCYELNGLFAALLRELGYNVREYFGRWLFGDRDPAVPRRNHRVVVVALAGHPNLIVEVGIAYPFLMAPLGFVFDVSQPVGRQVYRVVRDPTLSAVVEIRTRDGAWERLLSFDTSPQLPIDFAYANHWCRTHPESVFRRVLRAFLPADDGSTKAIVSEPDPETGELTPTFASTAPDGKQTRTPLRSEAALAEALREHFGIVEGLKS